jgi:hypothetical protein
MKKIYLFAASLVIGSAAMAQSGSEIAQPLRGDAGIPVNVQDNRPSQQPVQSNNERFTIIWEDDFSDGFANWTVNNQSSPPTDWFYTTDLNAPPFAALTPIQTPTAANGYALIDGDSQGDGSEQNSNLRMANPIDLSTYDFVNLRFYCVTRNWSSTYTVRVSNDGVNWTSFPVLEHITTNVNTDNPELVVVNITSVAAGQSTVWVEFNFTASWGWFWAIDDVSLVVPDLDNMTIQTPRYSNHNPDADSWCNLPYTVYSEDQVRPLVFNAVGFNAGTETQTGVFLEVNVTGPQGLDVTVSSASTTVPAGETAYFELAPWTPPAVSGTYTITYTIVQDQEDADPSDNVATRTFTVSPGEFARDNGNLNAISNLGLDDFWGGNGFCFDEPGEIWCIGAALSNASDPDAFFQYEIRAFSSTGLDYVTATDLLQVDESVMTLNGAGGNAYTWAMIDGGALPVFENDEYVAMFNTFTGNEQARIGISGQSPDFSTYLIAVFDTQDCNPCFTGSTYMVRIGMSQEWCESVALSVNEVVERVVVEELYPNPTSGFTTLEFNMLETSNVQVFLFDNMGRIVMNKDYGVQPAGEHRFEYDFSNVASGMYSLSIRANNSYTTKKLVIK